MNIEKLKQFKPSTTRPEDFERFWNGTLQETRKLDLNATVDHLPLRSTDDVDAYSVHFDSLHGVRISGLYAVPKGAKSPLPTLVIVPGYLSDPDFQKGWARQGYATLVVRPRGKSGSQDQFDPGYPGLLTHNIVDKYSYGYRGFYIDAVRAVDFLKTREEVDAGRIFVDGSSQGGALAFVVAAFCPEVKAVSAGVPYLAAHIDNLKFAKTYPYQEIGDYLSMYPEREDAVRQTLNYFDIINFGPMIKCPIIVNIGLQDNTCPPETGYAAYESIASRDKQVYLYDGYGHDGGRLDGHLPIVQQFFKKHWMKSGVQHDA